MRFLTISITVLLSIYAVEARAVEPDVKCESGKLKVTGKLASCLLTGESRAVIRGTEPDSSKCEGKFSSKFTGLEAKAAGQCKTEGDEADIKSDIKKLAEDIRGRLKYPGYVGKVRLITADAHYWLEDDGVEPEIAGCHRGYTEGTCNAAAVGANVVIGEACVTYNGDTLLLETNPDNPKCHPHHKEKVLNAGVVTDEDYSGHPYLYDCNAYCMGRYGLAGACVPGIVVNCFGVNVNSARCECPAP